MEKKKRFHVSFNERKSRLKSAEIKYYVTNFPKQNSTPKCLWFLSFWTFQSCSQYLSFHIEVFSTDSFKFVINSSISDVLAIASGPSGSSVEFVEHELAVAAC